MLGVHRSLARVPHSSKERGGGFLCQRESSGGSHTGCSGLDVTVCCPSRLTARMSHTHIHTQQHHHHQGTRAYPDCAWSVKNCNYLVHNIHDSYSILSQLRFSLEVIRNAGAGELQTSQYLPKITQRAGAGGPAASSPLSHPPGPGQPGL